jgi:ABC-type dipeptide/oligopeptide/nickel transport system permease subunit
VSTPLEVEPGGAVAASESDLVGSGSRIEGRSLGQIAWRRLKRDKVAIAGACFLIFLVLVAVFAPLITQLLGDPPTEFHQDLIDPATGGLPIGARGGQSWEHLMGVEPVNGRDIFSRVVYGARISLVIAFLATLLSVLIGTTLGVVS